MWSFSPPALHIGRDALTQVDADRYELFCLPLPNDPELTRRLKELRNNGQWFEDRLFGKLTINALDAWTKMVDKAALVFLREVLGGSIDDHEVEQSLSAVPAWFF
jgi:hypothetical protein